VQIDKIQKAVTEIYGNFIITHSEEDEICSFVYTTYPGDYIVRVIQKPYKDLVLDFEFTTEADYLMFIIQFS